MPQQSYCRIAPTFWTDPDVKRRLDREEKLAALYFFTSPHGNMAGLYYVPLQYAAAETGFSVEQLEGMLKGALSPFVTYDFETEEILVHRAAKHQVGEQLKLKDKRTAGIVRILADTHSPRLVARFLELYAAWVPLLYPEGDTPPPPEGASKGLASPPPRGFEALADADACTEAGASTEQSSSSSGAHTREEAISGFIQAVNAGQRSNPAIDQGRLRPIEHGHGTSRQVAAEWLEAGIPAELVLRTLEEGVERYVPDQRHPQISSLKYFDNRVRELWQLQEAEESHGRTQRAGAGPKVRGTNRKAAAPSIYDDPAERTGTDG